MPPDAWPTPTRWTECASPARRLGADLGRSPYYVIPPSSEPDKRRAAAGLLGEPAFDRARRYGDSEQVFDGIVNVPDPHWLHGVCENLLDGPRHEPVAKLAIRPRRGSGIVLASRQPVQLIGQTA